MLHCPVLPQRPVLAHRSALLQRPVLAGGDLRWRGSLFACAQDRREVRLLDLGGRHTAASELLAAIRHC
jgi:hypothetical protein